MSLEKLKDPFPEEDIEWRIAQSGKKTNGKIWAKCLAYISARAVQDRLDEVCGLGNWKMSYRSVPSDGKSTPGVICELSIRISFDDGTCEWITKEDGAEQTDFESFKGGISSALKRAASAWGIGRYLYRLESGFSEIVDQTTKGAQWAQTKEKESFYWIPPALPSWALPKTVQEKNSEPRPGNKTLPDNQKPMQKRNLIKNEAYDESGMHRPLGDPKKEAQAKEIENKASEPKEGGLEQNLLLSGKKTGWSKIDFVEYSKRRWNRLPSQLVGKELTFLIDLCSSTPPKEAIGRLPVSEDVPLNFEGPTHIHASEPEVNQNKSHS